MKSHLLCIIEGIETLLEEGYTTTRDVYVCLDYNEEIVAGKDNGAKKIATLLNERGIHFDSILDEGGGSTDVHAKNILDAHITMVGVAEKGYADYEITVKRIRWSLILSTKAYRTWAIIGFDYQDRKPPI